MGRARHSMEPDVGFKAEETRRFARKIVDNLMLGLQQENFRTTHIGCCTGIPRCNSKRVVGRSLAEVVIEEISKDMVGRDDERDSGTNELIVDRYECK